MTDNELKSYQSLVDKALADYLRNPTKANYKISLDAAMTFKTAILVNEHIKEGKE